MKTMTKIKYLAQSWTALCLTTLLGGCNADENPVTYKIGEKIPFEIQLNHPDEITVEGTKARTAIEGITLSNVWVVQYNAGNDQWLATKYYTAIVQDGDYKALVTTTESDFTNIESRFYVIVNAGNTFLTANGSITETDLKAKAVATASPLFSTSSAPLQLVAGPVLFKPTTEDGKTRAALVAPLERPYVRLECKYTSPARGSFTPTSLKITNLPNSLYVCKGEGIYPAGNTINSSPQSIWTTGSGAWAATAGVSCYIGENLRGSGTATTAKEKNLTGKGPGGNLTGCTYIDLTGTYKYASGHGSGITVTYRIYLGGNLINDYNLQRNTRYTVTVNVAGANSADIRVSVTSGNVAYFEEVKEVKPEYEVIL